MTKKLKIGIAGCGAIGSSLAKAIVRDFSKNAKLSALYDIDKKKSIELSRRAGSRSLAVKSLEELIERCEFVIEASCAGYSWDIARQVICAGRDVMVMSVGGLLHKQEKLYELAAKHNVNVYIPSGAICGIDALKAANCAKITRVTLTTRKPPQAFLNVPYVIKKKIDLGAIKKDKIIFEGTAEAAIKAFPQNINVAATLSLAGIGPKKTIVRIIASAQSRNNIHEVEVESSAGRIFTRTENVIHPENPKTSLLAVLSAQAVLKQALTPVHIGA